MQYKIIVDKQPSSNPSDERKEYTIDIEELRVKGSVYDSINITPDRTYVTRRLALSEYGVLSELVPPQEEDLGDLNIKLFEGDNYIYLYEMQGNRFCAEYLIKNDFTDTYVTNNQMNSAINQSAKTIEISVNQKLEGYSTTEQMNAAINLKSNSIMLEVNKKVNDKDLTGANIILRINNDKSESIISADKISLEGKEINLTSENISINSDFFQVSTEGKVTIYDNASSTSSFNFYIKNSNNQDNLLMKPTWIMMDNPTGDDRIHLYRGNDYVRISGKSGNYSVAIEPSSSNKNAKITITDGNSTTTITQSGITTPTLTQTSRVSEKKNFEKLTNALDLINKIDIYKYNLKTEKNTDKKHIGFVIGKGYKYRKEVTNKDNTGAEIYSLASLGIQGIKELDSRLSKLEKMLEVSK